jgi:hypothetical protein
MNPDVWACVHNFLMPYQQGMLRRVSTASHAGFAVCVALGNVAVYGDYCDAHLGHGDTAPFPVSPRALISEQRNHSADLTLIVCSSRYLRHNFAFNTLGPFTAIDMRPCTDLIEISGDFLPSAPLLKYVHLPASLTTINCSFLKESSVESIDLSLCSGLTAINDAFLHDTNTLRSVVLPASLTHIGNDCLAWSAVESIDLSLCSGLKTISDYFLRKTKTLRSVILPASLTHIGKAFL